MEDSLYAGWLKIGITLPEVLPPAEEGKVIAGYLRSGAIDLFHLRKPDSTRLQMENLINAIPEDLHPRLRLHDHFSLTARYDLGGVHLNSRNPMAPSSSRNVSRSCHSLEELAEVCGECYLFVTLSPVFDSISKPGYNSPFSGDLSRLKPLLEGKRVIAMGGVRFEDFPYLYQCGFSGAALLGSLWSGKHFPEGIC